MSTPTALVTNALEFAGPPAVVALGEAGFHVIVHDTAFRDPVLRTRYQQANPGVIVLPEQMPAEIVGAAWAGS
jgi:3-oxoacyl-[acyl-carrier protein] reductase